MARQVYRKSLLERMSSPEQLDKMIVITSPAAWLAMLGGALIVGVALTWSIVGRLPVKLTSSGIIVQDEGAFAMAADTGGIVSSLEVQEGDHVEEGDVVLVLSDEAVLNELEDLRERRAHVESVTLTSIGDVVTADNRELVNIKTQLSTVGLGTEQQQAMLDIYRKELDDVQDKLADAEAQMRTARDTYYSYIKSNKATSVELDYSEAQSELSRASSYYDSVANSAVTARYNYDSGLEALIGGEQKTRQEHVDALSSQLITAPEQDKPAIQAQIDAENANIGILAGVADGTDYDKLSADAIALLPPEGYASLGTVWNEYSRTQGLLETVEDDYNSVLAQYQSARDSLENYQDYAADFSSDKERISSVYNEKMAEYNKYYSQKITLESNISGIEGQMRSAQLGAGSQQGTLEAQFQSTKDAILSSLDAEIENREYSLEKTRIKSKLSGTIFNLRVSEGMALQQGGEYATIQQKSSENIIVCYIPITSGKKVTPGMEVIVCPTTVNRQEYGHMLAEVVSVDQYVATTLDMRTVLGDDNLVQAFMQNGPVVGVTCRMRMDPGTVSGYWWSNRKGAALSIPEGTMVTADIVTEEKAPITMLVPLLKEKLSMEDKSSEWAN